MAGNAHARRNRMRATPKHDPSLCLKCRFRPCEARKRKPRPYRNSNGNRHNPAANKKQKN